MSANIDPAKLKVVDLRNELSTRGLDTKGNKAALVKRLKDALESELNKGHCNCGNMINIDIIKQYNEKVRLECRITKELNNDNKGNCGKRYLREPMRTKMVEKLKIKSTVVFRSEQANELMVEGDVEPPHLYRADVLSTAKHQVISKTYLSKNPITALQLLKVGSLQGSIHNIGLDPFFVHFWSIHQQHIYRSCMKAHQCALSIDATGSIIKRIKNLDGSYSSSIFLYNAVMYSQNKQIPVFHMLTEKHNTNMISYWLGEWLRFGNPIPVEVICDSSVALLTACARVFTGLLTISDYVHALSTRHDVFCYIRIDVAHFIKIYSVFLKNANKSVKSLYLGIMGQLILCKDVDVARNIVFHLLLISRSKTSGNLPSGEISICSASKSYLKSLLDPNDTYDIEETGDIDIESILFDESEDDENFWVRWGSQIDEEVINLVNQQNADDDNAHFFPQFSDKLLKSLRWFPMWSNIYHSKFKSARVPASSAPVEGEFNIVKNHVFKLFPKPIRPDVFVEKYLEYMGGKCKIIDAELREKMDVTEKENPYEIPDRRRNLEVIKATQEVEDWGGLATSVENRNSRYLTKNYELFQATNENKKLQKIPIIKNGNISSLQAIKFKQEEFSFNNTCAFDSLLQIFLVGVCDHPQLREIFIRLENHMKFVKLVLYISNNGINQHAYRLRAEILKELYTESTTTLLENHYLVNCESNIITIVANLFGNLPSIQEASTCDEGCPPRNKNLRIICIQPLLIEGYLFKNVLTEFVMLKGPRKCPKEGCSGTEYTKINNIEIPDTSIADTSTEDLDTSQAENSVESKPAATEKSETKDPPSSKSLEKSKAEIGSDIAKSPEKPQPAEKIISTKSLENVVKSPEKVDKYSEEVTKSPEKAATAPVAPASSPDNTVKSLVEGQPASKVQNKEPAKVVAPENVITPTTTDESTEVKPSNQDAQNDDGPAAENDDTPEKMETNEGEATSGNNDNNAGATEDDKKRDKRKRDSDSPERTQKKRARSPRPIKEDEPAIDNNKVLLSWYDSDLNLQIEKESFLSAKPLTEVAFGYVWAGTRATHGVQSGKVCYEVKITEEIKWEDDFSQHRQQDRRHRGSDRRDSHRKDSKSDAKGVEEGKKVEESADGEKGKTEESVEKMETEESEKKTEESEKKTEDSEKKTETPSETEKTDESKEVLESAEKRETVPTEQDENESEVKMESDVAAEPTTDKTETDCKDVEVKSEPVIEKKEPIPTHFFRIGWSVTKSSLQLGEDQFSYAYESSGKFAKNGEFTDYGIKFGNGDVIGAFLEIDATEVILTFTVNGEAQPEATRIPKSDLPENFALFPHILTRNYAFEANFGEKEEPWFPAPSELSSFTYLSKVEEKTSGPVRPENRSECEVLLMCGLPASGKTHWVKEHVASNAEKDYTILGKVSMLERMTIFGESLQSRFHGKWQVFLDKMQKSLNKLLSMAALRRRNYIIDQTNVFPSAQRRKLRPFEGFKRRAIIVVVADEEQARRQSLQEAQEGKGVPESTILEMKAAMLLPEKGDWLEEVTYVGAEESEAKEIVKKYNVSGREAGYSSEKRYPHDNRRHDYRGRGFRGSWNNQYQRFDSRGRWNNQRSRGGGGWNRERYDSRDYRGGNRSYGDRDGYQDNYRYRSQPYNQRGGGRGSQGGWGNNSGWGGWNQHGGGGGYGNQNWGSNSQWKNAGNGSSSGGQGYGSYWNSYGHGQPYSQNWGQQ